MLISKIPTLSMMSNFVIHFENKPQCNSSFICKKFFAFEMFMPIFEVLFMIRSQIVSFSTCDSKTLFSIPLEPIYNVKLRQQKFSVHFKTSVHCQIIGDFSIYMSIMPMFFYNHYCHIAYLFCQNTGSQCANGESNKIVLDKKKAVRA